MEEEIKGGRTLEASELGRHFGYYGKRRPGQRQYDKSHDVGRVHSRLSEFRVNAEGSERSFQTRANKLDNCRDNSGKRYGGVMESPVLRNSVHRYALMPEAIRIQARDTQHDAGYDIYKLLPVQAAFNPTGASSLNL